MSDWLKTLERGMDKFTTEALKVTDEARKVVGVGVGTMSFELSRPHFALGDVVGGTLRLALTDPTEATRISIRLRATRERTSLGRGSDGRTSPVRRTETLHDFSCEIAGAGTYRDEALPFAVQIPAELETRVQAGGVLGDVLKVAQGIRSMTESPISWSLEAVVDVAWKRNPRKNIDLSVS